MVLKISQNKTTAVLLKFFTENLESVGYEIFLKKWKHASLAMLMEKSSSDMIKNMILKCYFWTKMLHSFTSLISFFCQLDFTCISYDINVYNTD